MNNRKNRGRSHADDILAQSKNRQDIYRRPQRGNLQRAAVESSLSSLQCLAAERMRECEICCSGGKARKMLCGPESFWQTLSRC